MKPTARIVLLLSTLSLFPINGVFAQSNFQLRFNDCCVPCPPEPTCPPITIQNEASCLDPCITSIASMAWQSSSIRSASSSLEEQIDVKLDLIRSKLQSIQPQDAPGSPTMDDLKKEIDRLRGLMNQGTSNTLTPTTKSKLRDTLVLVEKKLESRPRVWTSSTGQHTVVASMVNFDGKSVKLKKSDGHTCTVLVSSLSSFDRELLSISRVH